MAFCLIMPHKLVQEAILSLYKQCTQTLEQQTYPIFELMPAYAGFLSSPIWKALQATA